MLGTIVNAVSVVVGSLVGLLLKKGISVKNSEAVNKSLGIAIIIVGLNGVVSSMFSVNGKEITSSGELLLIISLALGTFIGTVLRLDDRLNSLGSFVEKKVKLGNFATGFVNATMIFCVGAMAIVGAVNDGIFSDHNTLFIKSALDGITSIVLSSILGIGVMFSAIPVLVYQGLISLGAGYIGSFLTGEVLSGLCMVGNAIIIAIGLTFLKKDIVKPTNMLPAIFIPVIYELLRMLWGKVF